MARRRRSLAGSLAGPLSGALSDRRVSGGAPPAPTTAFVLDRIVDAGGPMAAAYWNAAYAGSESYATGGGPLIRVRRSSDNALADIGADPVTGALDQAALAAHCGASNGFIHTFYDSTGNAKHVTQASNPAQCKIYDSATGILLDGTLPAPLWSLASFTEYVRADACGFSGSAQDITIWYFVRHQASAAAMRYALSISGSAAPDKYAVGAMTTTDVPWFGAGNANGNRFAGSALTTTSSVVVSKAGGAGLHTSECRQNGLATVATNDGMSVVPNIADTATSLGSLGGAASRWDGDLMGAALWAAHIISNASQLAALEALGAQMLAEAA